MCCPPHPHPHPHPAGTCPPIAYFHRSGGPRAHGSETTMSAVGMLKSLFRSTDMECPQKVRYAPPRLYLCRTAGARPEFTLFVVKNHTIRLHKWLTRDRLDGRRLVVFRVPTKTCFVGLDQRSNISACFMSYASCRFSVCLSVSPSLSVTLSLSLILSLSVSRRRIECCRIKYIGRNCRVVLVGGILLKAEQEVPAVPGTRVILNFNNKVTCHGTAVVCLAQEHPVCSGVYRSLCRRELLRRTIIDDGMSAAHYSQNRVPC